MYEKIENIKRPLKKGEIFLVPCIVRVGSMECYTQDPTELDIFLYTANTKQILEINPVISNLHNDRENGQKEKHYHLDYRFIKLYNPSENDTYGIHISVKSHSKHVYGTMYRPVPNDGDLVYFALPVINESFMGITPVEHISKSRLKHKCIHKGKCPHRGMDLSQVSPDEEGVITCPLHGLKFNSKTKQLINHEN